MNEQYKTSLYTDTLSWRNVKDDYIARTVCDHAYCPSRHTYQKKTLETQYQFILLQQLNRRSTVQKHDPEMHTYHI